MKANSFARRQLLKNMATLPVMYAFINDFYKLKAAAPSKMNHSKIPKTQEPLGKVGIGTYRTFDHTLTPALRKQLLKVLQVLLAVQGSCIDTSPMYGLSEKVLGELLSTISPQSKVFVATKVWTTGEKEGLAQIKHSMRNLKRTRIDLYQVHNLVDWKIQLKNLFNLQEKGFLRYVGISHYTIQAFSAVEQIMRNYPIDFIQIPYSIITRQAEQRLLPLAIEKKIAVIPNQSFEQGELFQHTKGKQIAKTLQHKFQISSWAQLFLKYVLSHPAVTCVIPGTGKVEHMLDNLQAGFGSYPDDKQRTNLVRYFEKVRK